MIETLARMHADEIIDRSVDVHRAGGRLNVAVAIDELQSKLASAGVAAETIEAWRKALAEVLFERLVEVASAAAELLENDGEITCRLDRTFTSDTLFAANPDHLAHARAEGRSLDAQEVRAW